MKEDCKSGNHDFIEIMRESFWDESSNITKWCQYCGGIKINCEMDGKFFGYVMKLQIPQILIDEKL